MFGRTRSLSPGKHRTHLVTLDESCGEAIKDLPRGAAEWGPIVLAFVSIAQLTRAPSRLVYECSRVREFF